MHICLFGGAFDPPHLGHQQVAHSLLKHKICDQVWFVPVKQHPFGKEVRTNGHREKMLDLILEPNMRIEAYELDHTGKSYSFNTLEALSQQYRKDRFSWVVGSDNLKKFHLWNQFEELLKKYAVYVYPRKDYSFQPLREGMIALEHFPEVTVSSTEVRENIALDKPINGLVDPKIERYITENNLYRA